MIDIILLVIIGIGAGVITGLLPGIHPNTITAFIISISPLLLSTFSPQAVMVGIVSMSLTNAFVSFIPSIYLGAPESETSLSVLPGHQMVLHGQGYEAIYLSVVGGVGVMIIALLLMPLLTFILPFLYATIRSYITFIIIVVVLLMIGMEKKKIPAMGIFLLSGILGMITSSPILLSPHTLFPIFTGLFGISAILLNCNQGVSFPPQNIQKNEIERKTSFLGVIKGFISGMVVGILPGIGPSQAGVLVTSITRGKGVKEFIIALGSINTVSTLFSLLSLYLISKPRSGAAVAIEWMSGIPTFQEFLLLIASAVIATGIAAIITLKLAKTFIMWMEKVNYQALLLIIMISLTIMVGILTGFPGLLILFTATAIGLLPPLWGVKRTQAMGVLLLPIIMWGIGVAPW